MLLNDISPKLMLKVDLLNDYKVNFELILLDKSRLDFDGEWANVFSSFSSNDSKFLIYFSEVFDFNINTNTNIICIPKNFINNQRQGDTISFNNETERYNYLKGIKNTFLEWSNSIVWGSNQYKPRISYNGKIWILF